MKFHHLDLLLSCPLSTIYIVCCNISIFSCFILIFFHFEELFKACKEQVIINPIQDEHFRYCSRIGGRKKPPLTKIIDTYPTMMKLGTVIPYLEKIQKIYDSRDTPSEFCWHHNFFTGNQQILLYKKIQVQIAF